MGLDNSEGEEKERERKREERRGGGKSLVKISFSRGNKKTKNPSVWRESLIKKSRVFNYQGNLLE